MAIEGEFLVSFEGELKGNIQVGMPTARLYKAYPEMHQDALKTSRGYSWFDIQLSGTTRDPKDNFAEKFDEVVDALQ